MPCLWAWSGSSWFNVPRPVIGRLPALFRSSQGPLRVALWGSYSTPTPPPPLLKKSGENQLINFSGFPAKCAGGPLIGSGPLVLFARSCSGRTNAFSGEAENPGVSGGGGGRAQSALKERARGQRPRARSFVWWPGGPAGPPGLPNAAAPRRPPHGPRLPCASAPPPAIRRLPEGVERLTRPRRGGGVLRAHGPQNHRRGGGQRPPPLRCGRFAPPPPRRAPRRFRQRQKGNAKARPHDLWGRALKPRQEGSRQRFRPLGQSRCPCPTGSGGLKPRPRATDVGQPHPQVRDARRARSTA